MNITKALLDELTCKAKESPRLRMSMDLRNSPDDQSQRMLNALEPGTVLPIHRHTTTSETVAILRGRAVQYLYDEEGRKTGGVYLAAGAAALCSPLDEWEGLEPVPAMSVDRGQWHRIESLESGTVILEAKDGPYAPIGPEDIMEL